ncbi:DNA polymerase III subunit gamma/tau [Candidatus Vidania fulgoroideae]|uniref:DNA polymerase III subunit gamma/tau n=1 Tax=Candidatus Vidania fulgoroideorum TaxID=881286 RepID=A0AAX3N8C9_9PROT|nr:DNA polymerase III subunit gamma/tau [Candidatus Vidania fulgoroideae]WDR79362.1 DNA polymerase III subunit gamma/tau [Candidatus Vidania fulgoroideae]
MKNFLYKKYRPTNILNFLGQKIAKSFFFFFLKKKKFPSSYIFYGSKGTGKTTFSKIFSKGIMCKKKRKICNCKSCINFKKNIDFNEIDAASNRKVENISIIFENIKYKPIFSNYKIYVLDEAHMLSKHAFNFMLNILENLPNYIKIILITSEIEKIPETVSSRCFKIPFEKFKEKKIYNFLKFIIKKENIYIKKKILKEISFCSNGSIRDALVQLDYFFVIKKFLNSKEIRKYFGLFNIKYSCKIVNYIIFNKKQRLLSIIKKINNEINFKNIYIKILEKINSIILYIYTNKYNIKFSKNYTKFKNLKVDIFLFRKLVVKEIENISLFPYKENFFSGIISIFININCSKSDLNR